ncbi:MAG: CPXCG motif-containing cysteine-rich protein, partial [Cyanobacteria bacterium SW_9_47_5]
MQTTTEFSCAFCGESNPTFVDLSAGMQQSYI